MIWLCCVVFREINFDRPGTYTYLSAVELWLWRRSRVARFSTTSSTSPPPTPAARHGRHSSAAERSSFLVVLLAIGSSVLHRRRGSGRRLSAAARAEEAADSRDVDGRRRRSTGSAGAAVSPDAAARGAHDAVERRSRGRERPADDRESRVAARGDRRRPNSTRLLRSHDSRRHSVVTTRRTDWPLGHSRTATRTVGVTMVVLFSAPHAFDFMLGTGPSDASLLEPADTSRNNHST